MVPSLFVVVFRWCSRYANPTISLLELQLTALLILQVFGPPPQNHVTSPLPQHGFARNSNWEFLGKSSSEAPGRDSDQSDLTVKLDFGLSHSMLTDEFRAAWPYEFGLVYSVTLTTDSLETSLQVRNEGQQNFEFQVLMHTYLSIAV